MATPARTSLSDLARGYRFPAVSFELTDDYVSRFLDAVEDASAVYRERGLAPPLAAAARGLGALLEVLELPDGTLHVGQEVVVRAGLPIGATVTLAGRVAERLERAGLIISVIEFELTPAGSDAAALTGRTTVAVPARSTSGGGS